MPSVSEDSVVGQTSDDAEVMIRPTDRQCADFGYQFAGQVIPNRCQTSKLQLCGRMADRHAKEFCIPDPVGRSFAAKIASAGSSITATPIA